MDIFYPPNDRKTDKISAYIEDRIGEIDAVIEKAATDLDREDYNQFLKELIELADFYARIN
jgi:hypothetical protein